MFCSISNVIPTNPVVSAKSGHLYERSVIEKHIEVEGKCPHTGEAMSTDDLIAVKAAKAAAPRPVAATSVPGLLGMLQDEWDSLMVETYTLRQHLNSVRQELSQALYQHDAACRVIARITKERDTARSQLQAVLSSSASNDVDMEGKESDGIPQRVLLRITTLSETLSKGRKKRPTPEGQASKDQIRGYTQQSSHKIHKSSSGGILCLAAHATNPALTVTGGVDKTAKVFNRVEGKVVASLSGHTKRVSDVSFVAGSDNVVTCSHDSSVRVWAKSGDSYAKKASVIIKAHDAEVTGVAVHPTAAYVVSSSLDKTWAFSDLETGRVYTTSKAEDVGAGLECVAFHPDGIIFGTGTGANLVRMWDVNTCTNVATFEGHTGVVNSVAFSENGYHMASASDDSTVRVYDLRKLKTLHEFKLGAAAQSVSFDASGKFLAVGAAGVAVYNAKAGQELVSFDSHSKPVQGVSFGPAAKYVASASLDRALTFYA